MAVDVSEPPVYNYGEGERFEIDDLLHIQKEQFKWFLQEDADPEDRKVQGFEEALQTTFPMETDDISLEYLHYEVGEPDVTPQEAIERGVTYSVPVTSRMRVVYKDTGEIIEEDVFLGDYPYMSENGNFVINGTERVITSQLIRSPGIVYDYDDSKERYTCKIIPYLGTWITIDIDTRHRMKISIDRQRRIEATTFMRVIPHEPQPNPPAEGEVEDVEDYYVMPHNEDIVEHFYDTKTISPDDPDELVNEYLAEDIVEETLAEDDEELDEDEEPEPEVEVIHSAGTRIESKVAKDILDLGYDEVKVVERVEGLNPVILNTLERDDTHDPQEAFKKLFGILRPNDPYSLENAREYIYGSFFDQERIDMERVGRFKINKKLGHKGTDPEDLDERILTPEDFLEAFDYFLEVSDGERDIDDIDHLSNRRVRTVGELLFQQAKIGLNRIERSIEDKLNVQTQNEERPTPAQLINIKPLTSDIRDFFASGRLSQFMDQTNPLDELTHKRRLSALGPGGLSRERAGFDVRDVHHTHYGRICPIETPEGPNIGLIISLACFARVNDLGFLETPYRKVENGEVTDEIVYLDAEDDERSNIASAGTDLTPSGKIKEDVVRGRQGGDFELIPKDEVEYIDVSPRQIVSVSAACIPFLENDDANRALMGSNMQRQAVPLIDTDKPRVATGMEKKAAVDSGSCVVAEEPGEVIKATSKEIWVENGEELEDDQVHPETGEIIAEEGDQKVDRYPLKKFKRSSQGMSFNQKPLVEVGDTVEEKDVLADGPAIDSGELALGKDALVAFMPWEGYNFEDAILVSERLVSEDVYTSVHIEDLEVAARETKVGMEEITRDIPSQSQEALENLDEDGIIEVGTYVEPGDILVGKVTPKSHVDLSPEYKLLHSIFGEKAKDVKDTSLTVPHGVKGVVVDVQVYDRDNHGDLDAGVEKKVKVYVADKRKIKVGDKLAGRHGNKGVIANILPKEDMPFTKDGRPVDVVLNPLGVPSRMNIGQVLETHINLAAEELGIEIVTPVFEGATEDDIAELLQEAGYPEDGKVVLRDGRTGEPFDQKVTIGNMYIMKLEHMAEDKVHSRSIGPYSLVTQQPLGGKAQFGGQRLGEMEVWALEAYGAAHTLREFLTVKSDDVNGRSRTYASIVKGEESFVPGIPESFNVLLKEMQGLGLDVRVFDEKDREIDVDELVTEDSG
ncbi:MAG: DNA-directed RNA polymerase subunit beta [bacterium]